MDNNIYKRKWEVINKYNERLDEKNYISTIYAHYTSMNSLFSILEGDSFWASNVRFSNDSLEERMLKIDGMENRDDYVLCYCSNDDILSQWRGYCHNGGASISLNLETPMEYSILHADYESSGKYVLYENCPLPVIYLNKKDVPEQVQENLKNAINSCKDSSDIKLEDMLPYLKNGHFREEKEERLLFSNTNGLFSNCIRFRTLPDGVKVPYIVVKCGNMGKMKTACPMDLDSFENKDLDEMLKGLLPALFPPIYIEEGYDQETKYYETVKIVKKYCMEKGIRCMPKIYCKGHLPIRKIRVAPTYDRERKAEQIKRFCQSKYWLKDVEVEVSDIPYIQPLL